jgi:2-polyprenyl-3-methyl-5-hydroxy-6-metoxy-1,4-benzoquinol methylase
MADMLVLRSAPRPRAGCPVCGADRHKTISRPRGYELVRCSCGMVYADVDPEAIDFDTLYSARYPTSAFMPQRPRKMRNGKAELRMLEGLTSGRALLDIGCSYGFFLEAAQAMGWTATGVELADDAAAYARSRGLDVRTGTVESVRLHPGTFDVVTIRHVLEHVAEPSQVLESARALLRDGGLLLVAVPNIKSLPARLFRNEWWWIDPPTHLHYFENTTLRSLLERHGFRSLRSVTRRGDDEHFGFYALFVANRRLGVARMFRRGRAPDATVVTAAEPAALPAARSAKTWQVVRRATELTAWMLRAVGFSLDRAGLGSELIVISRRVA